MTFFAVVATLEKIRPHIILNIAWKCCVIGGVVHMRSTFNGIFTYRLSKVVNFVFSLCRNNTHIFPFYLVVYRNESCDLDGDTTFELFLELL